MKNLLTHTYVITFFDEGKFCWRPRWEYTGANLNAVDLALVIAIGIIVFS